MKKSTKSKRIRKNNYNGRNVYGQRCIAKFVKLEKETALDQYMDIIADLEASQGQTIEYTIDSSCFSCEEAEQFNNKLIRIMELRSRMRGYSFTTGGFFTPQISA